MCFDWIYDVPVNSKVKILLASSFFITNITCAKETENKQEEWKREKNIQWPGNNNTENHKLNNQAEQ